MTEEKRVDSGQVDDREELSARLNSETAVLAWSELVRHFARGVLVHVSRELDLVEAAACLARDDTQMVQKWLDGGSVRRASDDDARDWNNREPEFWCVVTAPWVLVQEKTADTGESLARPRSVH